MAEMEDLRVEAEGPAVNTLAGGIPQYRDAQWINRDKTQLRVTEIDGTEYNIMASPDDPRFTRILYGDHDLGISPIPIRDMGLEELRALAMQAVTKWEQVALSQPIKVAGRVFAADKFSREKIEAAAQAAETAKKLGEPWKTRWPLKAESNKLETCEMTRDDFTQLWRALMWRNFGDMQSGKTGIVQKAADLKNRIKQAANEQEIAALIKQL